MVRLHPNLYCCKECDVYMLEEIDDRMHAANALVHDKSSFTTAIVCETCQKRWHPLAYANHASAGMCFKGLHEGMAQILEQSSAAATAAKGLALSVTVPPASAAAAAIAVASPATPANMMPMLAPQPMPLKAQSIFASADEQSEFSADVTPGAGGAGEAQATVHPWMVKSNRPTGTRSGPLTRWSKAEDEYFQECVKNYGNSWTQITQLLNQKFGTNRSVSAETTIADTNAFTLVSQRMNYASRKRKRAEAQTPKDVTPAKVKAVAQEDLADSLASAVEALSALQNVQNSSTSSGPQQSASSAAAAAQDDDNDEDSDDS